MKTLPDLWRTVMPFAAMLFAVLAVIFFGSGTSADMRVKLKDGRVLNLPVTPDQIDSVTFGSGPAGPVPAESGAMRRKQPVGRAAAQIKADEKSIRTSRDAEKRALDAAKAAGAAADTARAAAALAEREAAAATVARKSAEAAARAGPAATPGPASALNSSPPVRRSTGKPVRAAGRVLNIGPGKKYKRPSDAAGAAQDGDTVEIAAGTYKGDVAQWTASNLTIRGVGGRVHLDADGRCQAGKAIWVISGNDTAVDNIEFSNCRVPDRTGAGLLFEGRNLAVRNSFFHDNDMGLVTGNRQKGDVLVEGSEFARNMAPDKNGLGHNIYIGRERSFILRNSYVHGAVRGHDIKSRARENRILYNRIVDGPAGAAGYLVDIAEGGRAWLVGNVFHKSARAGNRPVVSFAAERRAAADRIALINNTLANEFDGGVFIQNRGGAAAILINNILAGPVDPATGPAELRNNLIVRNNPMIRPPTASGGQPVKASAGKGPLSGNFIAPEAGFTNPGQMDFSLSRRSPARNTGAEPGLVNRWPARPSAHYLHPRRQAPRPNDGRIDIGAYEYSAP